MEPQYLTYEQQQRHERWEKVKKRGPFVYIAISILILLCSYAAVCMGRVYGFRHGWFQSPGSFSWTDIIGDVVAGIVVGLWEWTHLLKRFELPDPTKDHASD